MTRSSDPASSKVLYRFQSARIYMHHTVTENPLPSDFVSHTHSMYEIYCFIDGCAEFVVEGMVYPLVPGSVIITCPGQTHHLMIKNSDIAYERMALLFSERLLPKSCQDFYNRIYNDTHLFRLTKDTFVWLKENLSIIRAHEESQELQEQLITALMLMMTARLDVNTVEDEILSTGNADELVQNLITYLNAHISESLSLERIEKHFYTNRNYLNRAFKSVMGCCIWEYIMKKRVFLAQKCLYQTFSIADD